MLFSIVIPTYNNCAELLACLRAVDGLLLQDFEVWVCVDGSTDDTLRQLASAKWSFPLQVLEHADKANHGRSATRNLALGAAQGDYLLFLDSDMRPDPHLLHAHLEVVSKGGAVSIGAVDYGDVMGNDWVRYLAERGVARFAHGGEVPHNYFITPNTALPCGWWKQLHGFDEAISHYGGEDMELGYRLHATFHPRFVSNKKAVAHTHQDKRLPEALAQLREYGRTGLAYIIRKWPGLSGIYWADRVHSGRAKDRLLRWLLKPFFRKCAVVLMPLTPWALRRHLISLLVVAHVHEGLRGRP